MCQRPLDRVLPAGREPFAWLRLNTLQQAREVRFPLKPSAKQDQSPSLSLLWSIVGRQKSEGGNFNELGTVGLVGLEAFPKYVLYVVRVSGRSSEARCL